MLINELHVRTVDSVLVCYVDYILSLHHSRVTIVLMASLISPMEKLRNLDAVASIRGECNYSNLHAPPGNTVNVI